MTKALGYDQYIVSGGDHGGVISGWMAHDYPNGLLAHHHHMLSYLRHAESPWLSGQVGCNPTRSEQDYVDVEKAQLFGHSAYVLTHVARGETLGAALQDNPVDQAAWIAEKWYCWADRRTKTRSGDRAHRSLEAFDKNPIPAEPHFFQSVLLEPHSGSFGIMASCWSRAKDSRLASFPTEDKDVVMSFKGDMFAGVAQEIVQIRIEA